MALIECGTHALIDATFDSIAKFNERKLARRLLASLRPGMLLLAERNLAGLELCGPVEATGSHLAWRIKKNLVLPPLWVLPIGSYVSVMPTPAEGQRLGNAGFHGRTPTGLPEGHLVRTIDYTATVRPQDRLAQAEQFHLATSLLDHRHVPHRSWPCFTTKRGGRERLRRTQEPPAGRLLHPALQDPRAHLSGDLRTSHRLSGTVRAQNPRSRTGRGRSRPDLLHHDGAARPAQDRRTDRSEHATPLRSPDPAGGPTPLLPREQGSCPGVVTTRPRLINSKIETRLGAEPPMRYPATVGTRRGCVLRGSSFDGLFG